MLKAVMSSEQRQYGNSVIHRIGPVMLGCIAPEARELLDHSVELWGKELRARGLDPKEDRNDGPEFLSWLIRKSGLLVVPASEWDTFERLVLSERTKFIKGDKHQARQTSYSMAYWFFRWSALVDIKEVP